MFHVEHMGRERTADVSRETLSVKRGKGSDGLHKRHVWKNKKPKK